MLWLCDRSSAPAGALTAQTQRGAPPGSSLTHSVLLRWSSEDALWTHCRSTMSKFAKALYDNAAECADELAFRKGDIVMVMEQNVSDTSGWWNCSLHGRRGLAPANRLVLLPQTVTAAGPLRHGAEEPAMNKAKSHVNVQNIYQIPSPPRPISTVTYECMDMMCKDPSLPSVAPSSQIPRQETNGLGLNKPPFSSLASSPKREVYDVPSQTRQTSLLVESSPPGQIPKTKFLASVLEPENTSDTPESLRSNSQTNTYVHAVPPSLAQDSAIPVPSGTEYQHKVPIGCSTLPNSRKHEWIYDVPAGSEKQSFPQGTYDTLPPRATCRQLYDTIPAQKTNPNSSIYDTPKPCIADKLCPPKAFPCPPLSNIPPTQQPTEESPYDVPPKEDPLPQVVSDPLGDHNSLERRGDNKNILELKRVRLQRMRNFLACTTFHDLPGSGMATVPENEQFRPGLSAVLSQRISTASSSSTSSSTSSCDSLALSSPSPEPLREVALSQEEACRKLLELQDSICGAMPQLMDFVSSNWRCKNHLEKHLKEIKEATETIVSSVTCFLNFALDIKGNARHLTDTNLQTRLYKQLSIVEDSGVILQQTASSLNTAGWPLDTLCQDAGQTQNPDQLDRFVMVARTVPDDVKRLVSIIYGNSKLLFKTPHKDQEPVSNRSPKQTKKSPDKTEGQESQEDDNDYVELQRKFEERKPEEILKGPKENISPASKQVENKRNSSDSSSSTEEHQPTSLSEHCRLYFGALQKAIGGFVESLQNDQPPEKFISQSKLVIMVGQRLLDTLCREARRRGSCKSLLCKSNHLCALLKQLAVATKKAAVHYPEKQALLEVQDFAKELAQIAQQFRISLDL
ncbi:cas scaffolding protein family member 4 isoform X2 [Xiphophorus maculatus]|uniref:Cas scaffold protein family member 4 n=1 Tax=Xiphophorus maculatus TaxID=8083 RepID=M4AHT7_XIPMA|nr:cas scaffolding protein family member 4 isoform X2 [Xiphophorus maculatus]